MNDLMELDRTELQNISGFTDNLFNRFVDYTDVRETTLNGYKTCLKQFVIWKDSKGILNPTRQDIKAYKEYLQESGLKAGTQAQYLRAVKHFFKWTSSEGLYPNISDNIKAPKVKADNTKKDALSEADIKRILQSIDTRTEAGKRDYAIIILCITGGLRIIELQRANIEDIKTIAGEKVLFIQGKGRSEKDEYKKLPEDVYNALENYLDTRANKKKSDPLFTGTSNRAKNQRITEPSISRIVKNILVNAGYDSERITAHSLRHTSVTLLLKAGATIQEAQAHARHSNPATTEIYAHNLEREKDRSEQIIYDQIFNPGKKKTTEEAINLLKNLSEDKQKEVIELLKAM